MGLKNADFFAKKIKNISDKYDNYFILWTAIKNFNLEIVLIWQAHLPPSARNIPDQSHMQDIGLAIAKKDYPTFLLSWNFPAKKNSQPVLRALHTAIVLYIWMLTCTVMGMLCQFGLDILY